MTGCYRLKRLDRPDVTKNYRAGRQLGTSSAKLLPDIGSPFPHEFEALLANPIRKLFIGPPTLLVVVHAVFVDPALKILGQGIGIPSQVSFVGEGRFDNVIE
jgi:hypothetical protein